MPSAVMKFPLVLLPVSLVFVSFIRLFFALLFRGRLFVLFLFYFGLRWPSLYIWSSNGAYGTVVTASGAVTKGRGTSTVDSSNADRNSYTVKIARACNCFLVTSYFSMKCIRRYVPCFFLGVNSCEARQGVRCLTSTNRVFVRLLLNGFRSENYLGLRLDLRVLQGPGLVTLYA